FNNSYGLAMLRSTAEKLNIKRISDLKAHPNLRMAFSYEFMERSDGFAGLVEQYGLDPKNYLRMNHSLVYTAIEEGKADIVEVFTTDSKIESLDMLVLEDDLN